ncbi:MAG: low specificity L-threonine aldolase, partial [Clostridia bacterium]|nr:low specificity L-threonine aldolase [Clostridia bacterium]
YGLGSKGCDITMKDLAELTDVFYIGGTKCGAFFGEAVVITNDELKENFRSYIKQNGGLLAKGWLLGIQFYTLFKDGLYFDITKKADELALEIKNAFESKGIPSYIESFTNQQFVILPNDAMEKLKKYIYEFEMKIDENHSCVRFCTSWSSKKEDVSELVKDIKSL